MSTKYVVVAAVTLSNKVTKNEVRRLVQEALEHIRGARVEKVTVRSVDLD